MAFWNRKKEERAENPQAAEEQKASDLFLELLLGRTKITRKEALEIPSVAAAISKITLTVARLPIKLYSTETENGKPAEIKDDRRTFLLSVDSGDTLNIVNFWQSVIEDYYLGSGGYIYIDRHNGRLRSLRYVDCDSVTTSENLDPIFKDFDIFVNGERHYPFEFIKILRKSKNGADSKSITQENPIALSVAYETLKFERKQVKKGGNKRGFFKSGKRLDKNAVTELKEAIQSIYTDDEGSERNAILNDGIDFKETSATSVELQLNENKRTNSDEIFSIFGFPSTVIRGNATENDKALYVECVVNLLNAIEAALDKDLLLESEKETRYFAFDTRDLTRGNIKERFEAYEIALKNHFMQTDEVRAEEELEPLGFNYITLSLADILYDPQTEKVFVPNTGQIANINVEEGGEE